MNEHFLKTRIDVATKQRVQLRAAEDFLTESSWLKRIVMRELQSSSQSLLSSQRPTVGPEAAAKPISVRLRRCDFQLLAARAEARSLRPATYVAVLTRAHLHRLAPLPKDELLALRGVTAELAALGRNINQIARLANQGRELPVSVRDEFRAMLRISEALRLHTKDLLKANLTSWESGDV
jgi:hypothetical protein